MPQLTIDGKTIDVEKGTTVLQAAEKLGIAIPYYCYHPGLSIAGNCRICLVEIEKSPKLQIACHTQVQEGMVVRTDTEWVKTSREHVLEFLLINHPLDCPVCDQAGECWLQDYYMKYGLYDSRFNENKVKKKKVVPIGPTVMLDSERCILCSRCVRFTDEITKTGEFGIFNRGDHAEIGLYPGLELKNKYSGNVVDICPVGALTDRDFRFKCRVWYLNSAPSICPGCSRGCNIEIHYVLDRPHIAGGDRVMRLKPRTNPEVNQWWICDEGRYGYKSIDHERIQKVSHRVNGKAEELSWEEVLTEVSEQIQRVRKEEWVALASPQLTNEELYLIRKLFREKLAWPNIFLFSPTLEGYEDNFLIRADKNPNTQGGLALGFAPLSPEALSKISFRALYLFGQDLFEVMDEEAAESILKRCDALVFQGSHWNRTAKRAQFLLPEATYAEKSGTFTNCDRRVQQIFPAFPPLGESRPAWSVLMSLGRKLGLPLPYRNPDQIFKEISQTVPAFKGLSYETIGKEGKVLACSLIFW